MYKKINIYTCLRLLSSFEVKVKTKIIPMLILSILIIFGGAYVFIQTKSEFILNKVSALVEEFSGAPITIESLPSIGIIPSPSLSIGKASWGTKDFSITFNKANVKFSLFALLRGNVSLSELQLDDLQLIYNDNPLIEPVEPDSLNSVNNEKNKSNIDHKPLNIEQKISQALTKLFKVVPHNVIINNAHIEYQDKKQHITMQNVNMLIDSFRTNQNAKVSMNSDVVYSTTKTTTLGEITKKYAIALNTDFNFLFMGDNLNLELTKLIVSPQSGFDFSQEIAVNGSTDVFFSPFYLRSLSAQIESPFVNAKIDQKGDINSSEGIFSIAAKIFPLTIVETFAPHLSFKNTQELQEADLNATVLFKDRVVNLQNIEVQSGQGRVKSALTYDMNKNKFFGDINLANIQFSNFITNNTVLKESQNDTNKISTSINDSESSNKSKNSESSGSNNNNNNNNDNANRKLDTESNTQKDKTNPQTSANNKQKGKRLHLPKALRETDFDVNIQASNIQYNRFIVDTLSAKVQGENSAFTMNPIHIQSMGSSIAAKVDMDLTKKQTIAAEIDIPSLNISTWSKALLGNEALAGEASIKSAIHFPINNPVNNLNGSGDIKVSSLHIQTKSLPLIAKILQKNEIRLETYQFSNGHIPFNINKSIVHLSKAYVSSKMFHAETSGDINLKTQNVDLKTQIEVAQKVSIPVDITGHMKDPKITINSANSIIGVDNQFQININKNTGKNIIKALDNIFK